MARPALAMFVARSAMVGLAACLIGVGALQAEVQNTSHNLAVSAASGAGGDQASGVCVFCHTPHLASPSRALWNLELSGITYELYESPTLQAEMQQPTGTTRLCLSCHDGTIALTTPRFGRALRRGRGRTVNRSLSLGTDLSDDHPVSFRYDSSMAVHSGDVVDPGLLPRRVQLEPGNMMQCTTCHDPHEDRNPMFLVVDNRFSRLCVTCHRLPGWEGSVHAVSSAPAAGRRSRGDRNSRLRTVGESGCDSCHRSHAAGRPQWLLRLDDEEENCMSCHDGGIATTDLRAEVRKISAHPMLETDWEHRPDEDLLTMNRHVTCGDCHAPHAIETGPARPPAVPASMRGVKGVDISGMPTAEASFEYEVCFGCHGLSEQQHTSVARVDSTTNARLEFDPVNASFHPVASPGRNTDIPGLIDGHGPASMIYCGDCHGSDEAGARGGVGGPHGSVYEPMLAREYQTLDPYPESVQGYALCYRCHDRNTLLADRGGFPHRRHVVELAASCATCHDAHGSRDNTHLINFMTRDRDGRGVVAPSGSGLLEFQDLGRFTGQCSLTCHGADHDPLVYR